MQGAGYDTAVPFQWPTPSFSVRQVVPEGFMWKSSSLLHSWTSISNEVTLKVAGLCHKISCAWVVKVVWGRGYSRWPFEGHLSKSRPLVQSVTATRENQKGGKWRLELTGLVGGRRRTSNVLCRSPSDFFSQLLLMKDCGKTSWNHSQSSSWECGNNIKINTLVFNNLLLSEAAGEPGRSWGSLDKAGQLGIPPYCSKWLGVWHRPHIVATVHIPSHPHPSRSKRAERHWLIKESPNPSFFV